MHGNHTSSLRGLPRVEVCTSYNTTSETHWPKWGWIFWILRTPVAAIAAPVLTAGTSCRAAERDSTVRSIFSPRSPCFPFLWRRLCVFSPPLFCHAIRTQTTIYHKKHITFCFGNYQMLYPVATTPLLNELHGGSFSGLTRTFFREKYPEIWEQREFNKLEFRFPGAGGESYQDVIQRVRPIIVELERQVIEGTISCRGRRVRRGGAGGMR